MKGEVNMMAHNDQCRCTECEIRPIRNLAQPQPAQTSMPEMDTPEWGDRTVVTPIQVEFPPPTMRQALDMLSGEGAPVLTTHDAIITARQLAGVRSNGELGIPPEVHGATVFGAVDLHVPAGGRIIALRVRAPTGDYAIWWDRDRSELVARPLVARRDPELDPPVAR
jgi:hypothetical protein